MQPIWTIVTQFPIPVGSSVPETDQSIFPDPPVILNKYFGNKYAFWTILAPPRDKSLILPRYRIIWPRQTWKICPGKCDLLHIICHPSEPGFDLVSPEMRRREKQGKKYWHGYHKSEGARHRITQHCLPWSVVLHILWGLSLEQHPGHEAAHKRAMQEIKREADLAQPKKIPMT